jgi:hypothetical protein
MRMSASRTRTGSPGSTVTTTVKWSAGARTRGALAAVGAASPVACCAAVPSLASGLTSAGATEVVTLPSASLASRCTCALGCGAVSRSSSSSFSSSSLSLPPVFFCRSTRAAWLASRRVVVTVMVGP